MNQIELCEYEPVKIDNDFKPVILDFLSKQDNQRFFKIVVKSDSQLYLKADKYVGTIQHKGLKINVFPKLFKNDGLTDDHKKMSIRNFMFMLNYGYNFAKMKKFDSAVEKDLESFFEVLIYLFAANLLEILKVNPNRSYVTIEDESNFLKGTWRLGDQLSQAPHLRHKFFVAYDDFTANNELNRILKYVSRMLIFASSNQGNKNLLQNILLVYAEIDDICKPENDTLDKVKFSRMNEEYKPIFELARLFLNKLSSQTLSSKISTFTFMFDMNVLFEQFIAGFIRKEYLIPCGLEMRTQARSRALLRNDKGDKCFALKPDILFKDKSNTDINKLIVDTKYKLLDDKDEKKYGVAQSDAYQMYAYAMKYDCKRIILLYPQHLEGKPIDINYNFDSTHKLHIRTVNLCRDLKKEEVELKKDLQNIFINLKEKLDGKFTTKNY